MKVRALFPLAAAAGMWVPTSLFAEQPAAKPAAAPAVNPNQKLADAVATRLRAGGLDAGSNVSIVAQDGAVHLTGTVRDAGQKDRIVAAVTGTAGVKSVRNALAVATAGIVQVQDAPLAAPLAPLPIATGNPVVEPAPVGLPGQISPDMQAPPLPPYAWPTYAPHNNVSRVAYPEAYPYNAFPFIGPYYPFPKVPLGWRKVTLEWEDGHWFMGRASAPHDYWRVRFW